MEDVATILARLDRIWRAVDIAGEAMAGRSEDVADQLGSALVDTVEEAVTLAHTLTVIVAYDDFWSDIDGLIDRWRQVESAALQAQPLDYAVTAALGVATEARRTLQTIRDAALLVDRAQVGLAAHPRDAAARGLLLTALAEMQQAADQAFVSALGHDHLGRLDAAMAVLTAVAARCGRERHVTRPRRR